MNAEISVFGVYVPSLLLLAPLIYLLVSAAKHMLGLVGLGRLSGSGLFDAAAFLCLLGGALHLISRGAL